jgi:branched-chain amino acid aminotransferase
LISVTPSKNSRLKTTDFNNLPFGMVFSDHMLVCNFKNNSWGPVQIMEYGDFSISPAAQVFHYGQSVFEGMKAFKNSSNDILFFRRDENLKRLNQSAKRMAIPEITSEIFYDGLNTLLKLDSEWCKSDPGFSIYIRPFIFASEPCIKASSSNEYTFMIILSPTKTYYNDPIHLIIEQEYSRSASGGVGFAKAAGNYGASFFPTNLAKKKGFTQVIWTDSKNHNLIEESGTMNIWFVIDNVLVTPKLSDTILGGITRDSVILISKDLGLTVQERDITVDEILEASKKGILNEAFGTGTAVSVLPISSITFKEDKVTFSNLETITLKLKDRLLSIQKGIALDSFGWTDKLTIN